MDWAPWYYAASILLAVAGLIATYVRALQNRITGVEKDLAEHKLESARQFVTARMLEQAEVRITEAINRLGDRLDRILEGKR